MSKEYKLATGAITCEDDENIECEIDDSIAPQLLVFHKPDDFEYLPEEDWIVEVILRKLG